MASQGTGALVVPPRPAPYRPAPPGPAAPRAWPVPLGLDALTRHVRAFAQMLTQLQGGRLREWMAAVRTDDLPSMHTFVNGLERDLDAVIAGLTLPWNSGIVEGHVNRIKMIKRQMYGRSRLLLLRKRVLLA